MASVAFLPPPPDIYDHLTSTLQRNGSLKPWLDLHAVARSIPYHLGRTYPADVEPCRLTTNILAVYDTIVAPSTSSLDSVANVVLAMVKNGISSNVLDRIPLGIAVPLHEIIRTCQSSPPMNLPADAYSLIRRPDLAQRSRSVQTPTLPARPKVGSSLESQCFQTLGKGPVVDRIFVCFMVA